MAPVARLQIKIKEVLVEPMSTDRIAELCGSTRQSTYLTLTRMEKAGLVSKKKVSTYVVWDLVR